MRTIPESSVLNKMMKVYTLPANLSQLAVPKMNEEVDISQVYRHNDKCIASKKSLYQTQNYIDMVKGIPSNIMIDILLNSDMHKGTSNIDHIEIIQKGMHAITSLGHAQVANSQKSTNNIRNVVQPEYVSLSGAKPDTEASTMKTKNIKSAWLLGDDLNRASEKTKISYEMFQMSSNNKHYPQSTTKSRQSFSPSNSKQNFLYHGDKRNHNDQNRQYNNQNKQNFPKEKKRN